MKVVTKVASTIILDNEKSIKEEDNPNEPYISMATAEDLEWCEELMDMVNEAYTRGEEGIVKPSQAALVKGIDTIQRLRIEETKEIFSRGKELLILWKTWKRPQQCEEGDPKNRSILGCIKLNLDALTDSSTGHRVGELGCLAVKHGEARNRGYGRRLVQAAEQYLVEHYQVTQWRLQILLPVHRNNPYKERLHSWYQRLGYTPLVAPISDLVGGDPKKDRRQSTSVVSHPDILFKAGDFLCPYKEFETDTIFMNYIKNVTT